MRERNPRACSAKETRPPPARHIEDREGLRQFIYRPPHERVDFFQDGETVAHHGSWLAGVDGAQPGIIMPADFAVGARYYQEVAPGVATDFAVNAAVGVTLETPAGTFEGWVEVTETNPLEPEEGASTKIYAPGIGLIDDDGISSSSR